LDFERFKGCVKRGIIILAAAAASKALKFLRKFCKEVVGYLITIGASEILY
jgi:hypothetical protein